MTQALSLAQILCNRGFELSAVCVGKSNRREIPEFFSQKIQAPIFQFESPNFVADKSNRGIKIGKTIFKSLSKFNTYRKSLHEIHEVVVEAKPDIIINFYEVLGGIYNFTYRPSCKFWSIGHQYLSHHPEFSFPKGNRLQKLLFVWNTKITSLGSQKKIALSFRGFYDSSVKNVHVFPPLLRSELQNLVVSNENFYLTYMVNPGYGEDILNFAKANPNINIVAFWDQKEAPKEYRPLKNVCFHQVNDQLFLQKMATCKALISTAGFESVCEAMYLGKPVMIIPVKGHYEQQCNALDAISAGAGISSKTYDFLKMEDFLKWGIYQPIEMKKWADGFEEHFLQLLESEFSTSLQAFQMLHN